MPTADRAPRRIDKPEPGFWMLKLGRNTPEVPACIRLVQATFEPGEPTNLMDRSPSLVALIRGKIVPLSEVWERRGRAITEQEYDYQLRLAHWADETGEPTPLAEPQAPIDFNALKPLF